MSTPETGQPVQLGLAKARQHLADLVNRVASGDEVFHLARRGRNVAALIASARLATLEETAQDYQKLADVTYALTTTLDIDEGLTRLARTVVPWLADVCIAELNVEGGSRVAAATIHRGAPNESVDPAELPEGDEPWSARLTSLGILDAMTVPLEARGHQLGAITVGSAAGPLDDRQRRLAHEVARRASMAAENARLYGEQRELAIRLQAALLGELPPVRGFEACARYQAADAGGAEVGGDWYDAFEVDGTICLVIGDVVGHDIDAAVAMGHLRTLVRAATTTVGADPSKVFETTDRLLASVGPPALATMIVAFARPLGDEWELCWANAGHHPPMVVEANGTCRFLQREPDVLLGVHPASRATNRERLGPRDRLLLYTDGLVERRGEDLDRGYLRLRRAAARKSGAPLTKLCDALLAEASSGDDVALLVVERTCVASGD
jgi:prevent-host-death family protein